MESANLSFLENAENEKRHKREETKFQRETYTSIHQSIPEFNLPPPGHIASTFLRFTGWGGTAGASHVGSLPTRFDRIFCLMGHDGSVWWWAYSCVGLPPWMLGAKPSLVMIDTLTARTVY